MTNAIFFQDGYAVIATPQGIVETTRLHEDRYVRIAETNGNDYPQLCEGAKRLGNTLIYRTDKRLARDCGAKIYKTRKGFDRAAARINDDDAY
jgi:hypothetical protein